VLCGHDGRRGYINHLAVAKDFRERGIGTALEKRVIGRLQNIGIRKCNGFVLEDNHNALEFWKSIGWSHRKDLSIISKNIIL
ncbi:MAG: GNAT family N-acetyltransferase, partial [Phycisphaerales bacterium]